MKVYLEVIQLTQVSRVPACPSAEGNHVKKPKKKSR
jgi:hypothetical protein